MLMVFDVPRLIGADPAANEEFDKAEDRSSV